MDDQWLVQGKDPPKQKQINPKSPSICGIHTQSEVKTHSQDTADETEDSATRTPTRPTPVSNDLKIETKSINNPQTRAKKNQIKNK